MYVHVNVRVLVCTCVSVNGSPCISVVSLFVFFVCVTVVRDCVSTCICHYVCINLYTFFYVYVGLCNYMYVYVNVTKCVCHLYGILCN